MGPVFEISPRTRQVATWRLIADVARHHHITAVREHRDEAAGANYLSVDGIGASFFVHEVHGVHAGGSDWSWSCVGSLRDAEELTEDIWHALPELPLADCAKPSALARTARLMAMAFELLSMDVSAVWTLRQPHGERVEDLLEQTNAGAPWYRQVDDARSETSHDDLWFLFKDQWVLAAFDLSRYQFATAEAAWDLSREGLPQETFTQSVAEIFEEWLQ